MGVVKWFPISKFVKNKPTNALKILRTKTKGQYKIEGNINKSMWRILKKD